MQRLFLEEGGFIDLTQGIDLSAALNFDQGGMDAFGLPKAHGEPVVMGDFVGSVRQGGVVNCRSLSLVPHGAGTQTESVGHLLRTRWSVLEALDPAGGFGYCVLLDVKTQTLAQSGEFYRASGEAADRVVSLSTLRTSWQAVSKPQGDAPRKLKALILRTSGTHGQSVAKPQEDRGQRSWSGTNPPYLTEEAMQWIVDLGIQHLLLDLPSVDRERDQGHLLNHRCFWEMPPGAEECVEEARYKTITELIVVPDDCPTGWGVVQIQIPPFWEDAAPSRPIFYPLRGLSNRVCTVE
ncbi:MAG: cyclase family protein [Myxococcota bacterium]